MMVEIDFGCKISENGWKGELCVKWPFIDPLIVSRYVMI